MFKIKVTAQNDTFMELYEVTVERDDAHLFGWTPTRDLNGLAAAGNASPQGHLVRWDHDVGRRR